MQCSHERGHRGRNASPWPACVDRAPLAALAAGVDIEAARASVEADRALILHRIRASADAEARDRGGGGGVTAGSAAAMIARVNTKISRAVRRGW